MLYYLHIMILYSWRCQVATRSVRLFERICGMIESLDRYIPVFEDWAWLFPEESYSLVAGAMKLTFHEYIKFMVDAIKYMRGTGFGNDEKLLLALRRSAN
jgi:hypothetical protein